MCIICAGLLFSARRCIKWPTNGNPVNCSMRMLCTRTSSRVFHATHSPMIRVSNMRCGPPIKPIQPYHAPISFPTRFFLTLRMNRLLHAKNILACPIPDDGWGYLSNRQLPVNAKERLAMCLNSEAPVLAEVVVDMTRADAAYGALAAFGQKVASRMVLREWVSHPELIWLAQCA